MYLKKHFRNWLYFIKIAIFQNKAVWYFNLCDVSFVV